MTVKLIHAQALPSLGDPNVLSVQFYLEDDALLFDLIYQGGYDGTTLQEGIKGIVSEFTAQFATMDEEYTENQAAITIRLPFHD